MIWYTTKRGKTADHSEQKHDHIPILRSKKGNHLLRRSVVKRKRKPDKKTDKDESREIYLPSALHSVNDAAVEQDE